MPSIIIFHMTQVLSFSLSTSIVSPLSFPYPPKTKETNNLFQAIQQPPCMFALKQNRREQKFPFEQNESLSNWLAQMGPWVGFDFTHADPTTTKCTSRTYSMFIFDKKRPRHKNQRHTQQLQLKMPTITKQVQLLIHYQVGMQLFI
ncbi:uncharacterized protein A4U43_C03F22780 [Asparagus officinalis]|uniref:Uncharacterized protein n=1 Tax=Asparagus officinalis TaxID=4686 RepID=A0A5P1FGJ2_ASPOF|nr:uncharacterized protein A4U43_C03F22780 [Asparagus officinalis]